MLLIMDGGGEWQMPAVVDANGQTGALFMETVPSCWGPRHPNKLGEEASKGCDSRATGGALHDSLGERGSWFPVPKSVRVRA